MHEHTNKVLWKLYYLNFLHISVEYYKVSGFFYMNRTKLLNYKLLKKKREQTWCGHGGKDKYNAYKDVCCITTHFTAEKVMPGNTGRSFSDFNYDDKLAEKYRRWHGFCVCVCVCLFVCLRWGRESSTEIYKAKTFTRHWQANSKLGNITFIQPVRVRWWTNVSRNA